MIKSKSVYTTEDSHSQDFHVCISRSFSLHRVINLFIFLEKCNYIVHNDLWIPFYSHLPIYCGYISMPVTTAGRMYYGFSTVSHVRAGGWKREFLNLTVLPSAWLNENTAFKFRKPLISAYWLLRAIWITWVITHAHTHMHTCAKGYKKTFKSLGAVPLIRGTVLCLIPVWWILRNLFQKCDPFD